MVYKFLDKKTSGSGIKNDDTLNRELAEELHKSVTKKVRKRKVHSSFTDITWGAELADTQLISKFNRNLIFIMFLIFSVDMHGLFL